jgi:hypothetical protein
MPVTSSSALTVSVTAERHQSPLPLSPDVTDNVVTGGAPSTILT